MDLGEHIKQHSALGASLGGKTKTAGVGGEHSTINAAIASFGSRYIARTNYLGAAIASISATFTNGSATVTTAGTFEISVNATGGLGVMLNDFLAPGGRRYRVKFRNSATSIVLWENFVGTTGAYTVSYERISHALVMMLPGEAPEFVTMVPGVHVQGLNRDACLFGFDRPFAPVGSLLGDNSLANITIGPVFSFLAIDNLISDLVEYAGSTFTYDNILFRVMNEGNSHSGGGFHLSTLPGGTIYLKNSDVLLGDQPFDIISIGDATRRSRVEITNTNIIQVPGHQSGGVSGGFIVYGFTDSFNATDYHDFYFSDVNINFPDMLRNPVTAGTFGAIQATGVNNTWELNNVTSVVTNSNASAAATERAGCVQVTAGIVRINGCNLKAGGSNTAGASGIALDVSGGTVYLENTTLEGNQFAIRQTGGTVYVGKGVTLNGPVSGTLLSEIRGVATLVAGTVTISTTKVHTASRIKLCHQTTGGTVGVLTLGTVINNTSFVINSSNVLDTSVVLWELEH